MYTHPPPFSRVGRFVLLRLQTVNSKRPVSGRGRRARTFRIHTGVPPTAHEQARHPGAAHGGVFVVHETIRRLATHKETTHTEHGLNLVVGGWFEMEHGVRVRASAGSVTLVPAGVPHRPLGGRDLEYWLVGFCASCVGLDEAHPVMAAFRRVRSGALPVLHLSKGQLRSLLPLVRELQAECRRGAPESAELVRGLLVVILVRVLRAMPALDAPVLTGTLAAEALTFIQRKCLTPISLKDVAAAVHRSPPHVAATVKGATGHTVGEWIAAGRVAEAASRLAHTDDSLEDIAAHVGWLDKTHFIRQFRKAHGMTPAAWRRAHRSRHIT